MDKWKALSIIGSTMRDTSHALRGERSSYLDDYMEKANLMEESRLKQVAKQTVAETFKKEGVGGLGKLLQENPDNEFVVDAVNEFGTLQKTIREMEEKRKEVYSVGSSGSLEKIGDVPQNSIIRAGTGSEITGMSADDQIKARSLARRLYGVRGAEKGLPTIIASMKEGKTVDQIEDLIRFGGQSKEFTGPIRDAAQEILISSNGAMSEKALDYIDDELSKGNVDGVKSKLKKLARDTGGTEVKRNIQGKERTVEFLGEIQDDLNALEQSGVNTNIFTGSIEDMNKKIGRVNDPALRKIATKIKVAIQTYRRSMSGIAFSVPESQEYADMFPAIGRTANFNTANISALQEVISGDLNNFYSLSMGSDNYQKLFGEKSAPEQGGGEPQGQPQGVEMEDANGNRALVDPQTGKVIKEL